METKKFLPAVVVAFLFLLGSNYVVHGIWLNPVYELYPDSWRPLEQQVAKMWIMWIGNLLFTVMFAFVYARGAEQKAWTGQGIRYGAIVALFVVIPCTLGEYVIFRVPYRLALNWMAVGLGQTVVMGLIVAYFLRKPPAAAAARTTAPSATPPAAKK